MKKEIKKISAGKGIIPLGDRILIEEETETRENKTASGIIIPVTVNEDKGSKRGKVVAVGVGRYEDGVLVKVSVEVGNEVLFQWGDKVKVDGEEFYIVRENEVLAILN